jgi:hypothetical protein
MDVASNCKWTNMEKFYEKQSQYPHWNIVQDGESSNKVDFRLPVTFFFAMSIITTF